VRIAAALPPTAGVWFGMPFATAQEKVYDLSSLRVKGSVAEATAAAAKGAEQLGMQVTLTDPASGTVEAVSQTTWYGFVSDVAVRVLAEGEGVRIDIRSTSRIAAPDMGANAAQVKSLSNEIALILR
jgi:uncharacterized protein (DUF1499 family)